MTRARMRAGLAVLRLHGRRVGFFAAAFLAAVAWAAVPAVAAASQLIDRNGTHVRIRVDGQGRALVSYTKDGQRKSVLVWGAENALPPTAAKHQVAFRLDYSGNAAAGFTGTCGRYDGPPLPYLVASCKASDGSYWAVQEWPQPLPDLGYAPWTDAQRSLSMDVSHWKGPIAHLTAYADWVYSGKFHSIFGQYTYDGVPVHGFGTTRVGVPTDGFGRLIYLDTYDSPYGAGWERENSFVSHNPSGVYCYGFYSFDPTRGGYVHPPGQTAPRGPGVGSKYRLLAIGPGVTPDVETNVTDPGDFDKKSADNMAFRLNEWRLFSTFIGADKQCRLGRALGGVNVVAQKSWFSSSPGGDAITSFTLTTPLYFNVQFAQAPPASNGVLTNAAVRWLHQGYGTTAMRTTTVTVSSNGLVASAPFELRQNNRRYMGTWTATLTVGGLAVAQGTVEASLIPGTPANVTPPVISGAAVVGNTLTVSTGTWTFTPVSYQYYWDRCAPQKSCVFLSSTSTYTLTSADVGSTITVWVYATDASGRGAQGGATITVGTG